MASLPLSRSSTYSSSDSDDSEADSAMLAGCSLQEIRQEDLAAILPDQQECDAFGAFEENEKNSPQTGDASGSDMELPQQAVNALIQRTTESSSESESHPPPNPGSLYANSLLQQFVAQTQMLNTSSTNNSQDLPSGAQSAYSSNSGALESDAVKRKRGRPKKVRKTLNNSKEKASKPLNSVEYCGYPNVSPDSGIQNSPDHVTSPECSPLPATAAPKTKYKPEKERKSSSSVASSKIKEQPKLTVTSNRFDRILYGHADRVLYPPRRKAGRPPVSSRKGPGRPPKHKTLIEQKQNVGQEKGGGSKVVLSKSKKSDKDRNCSTKVSKASHLYEICERVSKSLEFINKADGDKVDSKSKQIEKEKCKYLTLKNAKLMHSKHKHRKHKKCKFKIMKAVTSTSATAPDDIKLNSEIDKLEQDFIKFCNISVNKPVKENVPEILKTLKKVSKKRKTSDYNERKKKKQNTANVKEPTSNEQRLPLKKRHYHLTSNNENKPDNAINALSEENESKNKSNKKLDLAKSPIHNNQSKQPIKVSSINNNEYEVNNVESHIDEAIEACITKYSSPAVIKIDQNVKVDDTVPNDTKLPSSLTTPKKRHRLEQNIHSLPENMNEVSIKNESLENVVNELKMKRNLTSKLNENTIKRSDTRKKNRLEDLTSTLASKISTNDDDSAMNRRRKDGDKVKSEADRASVIKYPVCKKANPIEAENLDLVVDVKPTGIFMPTVDLELEKPRSGENKIDSNKQIAESVEGVKKPNIKEMKRKVRKRRTINRTGFPTVKRKKKKPTPIQPTTLSLPNSCDRVPNDGEEYLNFVERTSSPCSSDIFSKFEVLSECNSLPQDERIDFDSLDQEGMMLRSRDISPANLTDVSTTHKFTPDHHTRSSSLEDLSLELRLEKLKSGKIKRKRESLERKCNDNTMKRKLREISPANSLEPITEKRLKDDLVNGSGDESRRSRRMPRWRKKYLIAGLFSDFYKGGEETPKLRRNETLCNKAKIIYKPEEHPYGLLPPPLHCGKSIRCTYIPFQLPYDLWWQHTHSQLPGRDIVPSWNYKKIRTNVYNVKNTATACESQACNCTSGCGDNCINRLVLAECPATHRCQNQKIQKHEWAPGLEKFMTANKGWGVKTKLPIKNGEFILEYVGEVVSDQEFKERMASIYVNDTHHYCLHLDGGLVIDGHRMGGDGRFVNHSCEPNCEIQKWSVNGQFRMALFSIRDINGGEELTYDYNFSLFNPAEGQECKCGSEDCRGVIGGKSQRIRQIQTAAANSSTVPARVGRPRKSQARKSSNGPKEAKEQAVQAQPPPPPIATPQIKPMSHTQRLFVLEHHCFLLRNLKKVKRLRDRSVSVASRTQAPTPTPSNHQSTTTFLNHLNALRQPRNMTTRRLAQVEDDPELKKAVHLANVLRDLFNVVLEARNENGEKLSVPFMQCPSKRKLPDYYQKITEPIDLATIEMHIESGFYKNVESFDADMNKLFTNVVKYFGRTNELGICSARLKKVYNEAKTESLPKFENVLGVKPPAKFLAHRKKTEEEDIIRCICGMYRDEGLMIQCERCLVWQHCECVKADENAPSYHCEKCMPRDVDYEIPLEDEYTEHGHQYYMTLLRGDLQLRQGDTVYVLRDIPIPGTDKKHTYNTIGEIKYSDLDIFRIERLWKDSRTSQRFAYGHHYLRPHETYHEPTRKFYQNEVMRVPLYEAVPVDLIISHCWVMDTNTYCKGRPIGAPEEHIYICEYRVDKGARLFSKVSSKSKFPICTKSYAFELFDTRQKISRTYTPHDLDPVFTKQRGRKPQDIDDNKSISLTLNIPIVRTPTERKARLNTILLKLLSKMPTKQVLDVSYLLEGGRRRKKQT